MTENKEKFRREEAGEGLQERLSLRPGVLAEKLRQQSFYKAVTAVYVNPTALFAQIRINGLLDGKAVVCPSAKMKKGLHLLRPYKIPYARLSYAVTPKGMDEYGEILTTGTQATDITIGLSVVDCLAVDRRGCMVGDGNGFFDLSLAILSSWGRVAANHVIVAAAPEEAIVEESLADEPWDCFADILLTGNEVLPLAGRGKKKEIRLYWDFLSEKRIRKVTPLWKLRQNLEGSNGQR